MYIWNMIIHHPQNSFERNLKAQETAALYKFLSNWTLEITDWKMESVNLRTQETFGPQPSWLRALIARLQPHLSPLSWGQDGD